MTKQYLLINFNEAISANTESYQVDLIAIINTSDCNIERINFDKIYDILTGYILVSGKWNQIAMLESNIEKFIDKTAVNLKVSKPNISQDLVPESNKSGINQVGFIPYEINVTNLDEAGIVHKVVDFLAFQGIEIDNLNAKVYTSEYNSRLIKLNVKIKVPGDLNIASLKEQFDIMCYDENLDATFKVPSISS